MYTEEKSPTSVVQYVPFEKMAKGYDCSYTASAGFNGIIAGMPFDDSGDSADDNEMCTPAEYDSSMMARMPLKATWEEVEPSEFSEKTVNPIRRIVDAMQIKPNPDKPLISLHVGDPTVSGILPAHPAIAAAVMESLITGKGNGYGPAFGLADARKALAEFVSTPGTPVTADDIILASGCSHALQIAIEVLANPGQNILIPAPGFPLYQTLSVPLDVEPRNYNLLSHRNWEVDLDHLESQIDGNTCAIIVNNPSNPTGSVYSKQHLEAILRVADRHKIPIIADEIYGDMVYDGAEFFPIASLEPKVPTITCDGISKRYLVPGWRLGWLIIHDQPKGTMTAIRDSARKLSQKIVGPSALIQSALPAILKNTPESFFQRTRDILSENVKVVLSELGNVKGLKPCVAQGAMYLMVNLDMDCFPEFQNELHFCKQLIAEESVYCLPGSIFSYENAIRLVMAYPKEQIRDACHRIKAFCGRHFCPKNIDLVQTNLTNGYHPHSHTRGIYIKNNNRYY